MVSSLTNSGACGRESARLMAPIQQVSTRKGDFQVWSDPTTDKARIGIPLDIALGPNDTGRCRSLPAKDALSAGPQAPHLVPPQERLMMRPSSGRGENTII